MKEEANAGEPAKVEPETGAAESPDIEGGSEMDTPPKKRIKHASPEQREIARLLSGISGSLAISTKKNSDYITLDEQEGPNKNAVSVLRGKVVFMVQDWTAEEQARQLKIETLRRNHPTSKRLAFPGLTTAVINANREFFQKMLTDARDASKSAQL
jgi:hypothetical protein